jgi:membrane associated rhomboid family serine protease
LARGQANVFPLRDNIAWTQFPRVMWTIIGLNVAAYLYQVSLPAGEAQNFLVHHALVPRRYFFPSWGESVGLSPFDITPFLTNTFLHGGLLHIVLNLWTLYIFGPALEERLGPGRFAALYLGSAIAASVTHAVFNASSPIPALGASGAIAGVIAAYATKFPYAWIRVLVLIVIIPVLFDVPALFFAGLWFIVQILQGTSSLFTQSAIGGIAWWAHIGGFVAGWYLVRKLDPAPALAWPGVRWTPSGVRFGWQPWR